MGCSGSIKIFEVEYYINDDLERKNLEFRIKDSINFISYNQITKYFFENLKKTTTPKNKEKEENDDEYNKNIESSQLKFDDIKFDYINYLTDDNGWLILPENKFIALGWGNTKIKLMIKITILTKYELNIQKVYDKKIIEVNEINDVINNLSNNNSNFNTSTICSNTKLDLVVLTSNPLMDGDKELRTMNDFNKVTSSIQKVIQESLNSISVEFWPLTISRFKEIISNNKYKPTILHLICKSTYKDENINLIFEKEDFNLQFIDKNILKKIIDSDNDIKNNIKDINLVISTQLAEDAKEMFTDFGFKNILIEHTTLTDVDYISEFNSTFYSDIIFSECQSIKDLYEDALNYFEYDDIFCCCFHSHKNKCFFMKNLINELYNEENNKDLFKTIPHFCHLRMTDEKPSNYDYKEDFCMMKGHLFSKFKEGNLNFKGIKKSTKKQNICCCSKDNHHITKVFSFKFDESKENLLIKFGGKEKSNRNNYIPDFSKMDLLVGKNKIIYNVIKFIIEKKFNINIFCENENDYSIYDLRELANIIIEYYRERGIEEYENEDHDIINENKDMKFIKNSSLLYKTEIQNKIIDLTIEKTNVLNELNFSKKEIYFVLLDNNFSDELIQKCTKKMNKIVFLSFKKIKDLKYYQELKNLSTFNKYVKGQLKEVNNALLKN